MTAAEEHAVKRALHCDNEVFLLVVTGMPPEQLKEFVRQCVEAEARRKKRKGIA